MSGVGLHWKLGSFCAIFEYVVAVLGIGPHLGFYFGIEVSFSIFRLAPLPRGNYKESRSRDSSSCFFRIFCDGVPCGMIVLVEFVEIF